VARVRLLRSWLFPALGPPSSTTLPAPCRGILTPLYDFLAVFLAWSTSCFALLILALRSAWSLSVPLCLGISRSISSRQRTSSSGVWARRYSCSALWY